MRFLKHTTLPPPLVLPSNSVLSCSSVDGIRVVRLLKPKGELREITGNKGEQCWRESRRFKTGEKERLAVCGSLPLRTTNLPVASQTRFRHGAVAPVLSLSLSLVASCAHLTVTCAFLASSPYCRSPVPYLPATHLRLPCCAISYCA